MDVSMTKKPLISILYGNEFILCKMFVLHLETFVCQDLQAKVSCQSQRHDECWDNCTKWHYVVRLFELKLC